MKQLFGLYRRNGIYYAQNHQNGKQESLRTRDEAAAKALLHSKMKLPFRKPSCPVINGPRRLTKKSAPSPRLNTKPSSRTKIMERRAFYQLAWHMGAAQTDLATLTAEDVDWEQKTIGFFRRKTGTVAQLHFGPAVEAILQDLPGSGPTVSLHCHYDRRRPFHLV
jgi:hypothetical protein